MQLNVEFDIIPHVPLYYFDVYHIPRNPDKIDKNGTPIWDSNIECFSQVGYMINQYKMHCDFTQEDALCDLFFQSKLKKFFDCVIPVPSSSSKRHISFVAKKIAYRLEIPYENILEKTTNEQMKKKTVSERKQEKVSIKCTTDSLQYNRILLIDDICKTGTTLRECVKVLKNINSSCDITAFCFCKTKDKD